MEALSAGSKFGLVTIVRREKPATGRNLSYRCDCDCGRSFVTRASRLLKGSTRSCGCARSRFLSEANRVHGLGLTRVYNTWKSMKGRCLNPNAHGYSDYGGRGISICIRWLSFEAFLQDMGHPPAGMSIDRIDNNGNYEPGNCRWATAGEQRRNNRFIRLLTFDGKTMCMGDWAVAIGISGTALSKRLERLSVADALTRPKGTRS